MPGTWPCRVPELLPAGAGQCRGWRPILCTVVSCAGTEPVLLWVEAGAEMAFPANTGGQLWFLLRHLSRLNPRVSLRALLSALSFLHTHLPTTHLGCLQVLCFFPSNSPPHSTCQSRRSPTAFLLPVTSSHSIVQPKPQGDIHERSRTWNFPCPSPHLFTSSHAPLSRKKIMLKLVSLKYPQGSGMIQDKIRQLFLRSSIHRSPSFVCHFSGVKAFHSDSLWIIFH